MVVYLVFQMHTYNSTPTLYTHRVQYMFMNIYIGITVSLSTLYVLIAL